jgi:hypothetical protein
VTRDSKKEIKEISSEKPEVARRRRLSIFAKETGDQFFTTEYEKLMQGRTELFSALQQIQFTMLST